MTYAVATSEDVNGPMRYHNPLFDFLGPLPLTEVRLVPHAEAGGGT